MVNNLILYVDLSGRQHILPLDKEISDVNFDEITSFTVIGPGCRVSNYASTAEHYVVGIPYMYSNIEKDDYYDKKHLINDILNNGRQVAGDEANCYYEMLTENICYKTSNVHVVSSQNELLRIMMKFIEENEQTIGREQKPAIRTGSRRYIIKR